MAGVPMKVVPCGTCGTQLQAPMDAAAVGCPYCNAITQSQPMVAVQMAQPTANPAYAPAPAAPNPYAPAAAPNPYGPTSTPYAPPPAGAPAFTPPAPNDPNAIGAGWGQPPPYTKDGKVDVQAAAKSEIPLPPLKEPIKAGDLPNGSILNAAPGNKPPSCKEPFWALLFLLCCIAVIAVMGAGWSKSPPLADIFAPAPPPPPSNATIEDSRLNPYANYTTPSPPPPPPAPSRIDRTRLPYNIAGTVILTCIAGVFASTLSVCCLRKNAKAMIYMVFVFLVLFILAYCAILAYFVLWWVGLIPLVLLLFLLLFFNQLKRQVRIAAAIIDEATTIMFKYPATVFVSVVSVVLTVIATICYVLGLIGVVTGFAGSGRVVAAIFVILMWYWTTEAITYIAHTTCSGVYATYYFLHAAGANIVQPTWNAFYRTMRYNLGTIFVASICVPILQFVRGMLRSMMNSLSNSDGLGALLCCCILCCLMCITAFFDFINYYLLVHVAMYGTGFCTSARNTYELMCYSGIQCMVTTDLTGLALYVTAFLAAALTCFGGACFALLFFGTYWVPILIFSLIGFVIGIIECWVLLSPVRSGIMTIFVCFAEHPHLLENNMPGIYHALYDAYPVKMNYVKAGIPITATTGQQHGKDIPASALPPPATPSAAAPAPAAAAAPPYSPAAPAPAPAYQPAPAQAAAPVKQ